jgi:hypothetical protein
MSKKKGTARIQRVELHTYDLPVHCPFCGQTPDNRKGGEMLGLKKKVCKHLLFMAHDEGFEYRSDRFNRLMKIPKGDFEPKDEDFHVDGSFDAFTDKTPAPEGVKFAVYVPGPSGFGGYYGFAPLEDEL